MCGRHTNKELSAKREWRAWVVFLCLLLLWQFITKTEPLGFLDTWLSIKQLICEARHLKREGKIAYQVNQLWPWAATRLNINIFKGSLNMSDSRGHDIVSSHAAPGREEKWEMDAACTEHPDCSPMEASSCWAPAQGFWGFIRFLLCFILSYPTIFYFIGLLLAVYWFRGTGTCVTSHDCMNTAAEALSKTANIREFPTELRDLAGLTAFLRNWK